MKKENKILVAFLIAFGLVTIYLLLKIYSPQINITNSTSLLPIFLTGLITGGLTCLAVQGGLLASTIAMTKSQASLMQGRRNNALPITVFLISKLIAYTIVGFLLGWFGSLFQLSLTAQIVMQVIVIVFMLGTALNILEVHPFFRYFAIQPPKFITRRIRNFSKGKNLPAGGQGIFAPAILGAFTVFIPCGTTQAMMALAIGAGNPLLGAAILFAFILGTSPLFFILGYFATKLGDVYQKRFMRIAAFVLILLALFNLRNALGLAGINLNINLSPTQSQATDTNQVATDNPIIEFQQNGYSPTNITVKAGSNITLTLKNTNGAGCIQSFVIPKLGLNKIVQLGSTETLTFTAPTQKVTIPFMCGMGMYRGVINVI